jgi:ATP-dependent Lon protease
MKGKGGFKITGQIGDVMKESMEAALTWVRSNAESLGLEEDFTKDVDIHIHVPAGAIPKDGPSAGVTMATALVSLLTDVRVRPLTAMTGEITLSGNVLPVGGIKEKFLAAKRAGVRDVILPVDCRQQVEEDLTPEQIEGVVIHYASVIEDVLVPVAFVCGWILQSGIAKGSGQLPLGVYPESCADSVPILWCAQGFIGL